ncbi:MAG: hypothetical protein ACXVAX_10455, partial [Pseudobdellovibrio sp.]
MKKIIFLLSIFSLLAACSTNDSKSESKEAVKAGGELGVPKEIYKKTSSAIFEVVVDKVEDPFIKYEKPLPVDKLPFQLRNEKFLSIGTAFAVGPNRFVSAAHVFAVQIKNPWNEYYLR